ncbi:MAG: UDP-N-acetylmuramoyl-tripeptide--D-alanyl-D-alanine ligase [Cycloclasticus sp.]
MSLQQLASTVNGHLVGENLSFSAISSDTRSLKEGDLFVALQGENYDANSFVASAREKGAVAALVSADVTVDMPYVKVEDTLQALTTLATAERQRADIPLVAITGSNGKTSVKEMLASILSQSSRVLATEGNLNNQIGVPLTLLKLSEDHQLAVIEMGASHLGDIAHLCTIAKPTVAILNNVAAAHLEGFGDLDGVATAKGEIISGLSESGTAVLNKEEPWFDQWLALANGRSVMSFGWSDSADVWADISSVKTGLVDGQFKTSFVLNYQQQSVVIHLNLIGQHNALNALAASCAALTLGVSLESIATGLAKLKAVKGRMQSLNGLAGSVVINDCYNANPKSFEAAMSSLKNIDRPVWLALGDFAELGVNSQQIHQQLGEKIANSQVENFFAVGEKMQLAVAAFNKVVGSNERRAQHFASKEEMALALRQALHSNVVVLVKGSRSQGLESVVEKIIIKKEGSACC